MCAAECGSVVCRWGAVAIVTVPGVYPTSVGSAWVEDGAGSRGVQLQRRRAAHSTVGTCVCVCGGVKWNPLAGQSSSLSTRSSGGGRRTKSPKREGAGWV